MTVTPTSDNDDVTFTPASLTFTSANWDIPETVTVSAARDDDADADQAKITHKVDGYGDVTTAANVTVVVSEIANAPGAPRNLTATPGDGEVTLTWDPPLSDGGTPIIRYEYQVDEGAWSETDGGPARHVVDGLTNGTPYRFAVRAINSVNEPEPGPRGRPPPRYPRRRALSLSSRKPSLTFVNLGMSWTGRRNAGPSRVRQKR